MHVLQLFSQSRRGMMTFHLCVIIVMILLLPEFGLIAASPGSELVEKPMNSSENKIEVQSRGNMVDVDVSYSQDPHWPGVKMLEFDLGAFDANAEHDFTITGLPAEYHIGVALVRSGNAKVVDLEQLIGIKKWQVEWLSADGATHFRHQHAGSNKDPVMIMSDAEGLKKWSTSADQTYHLRLKVIERTRVRGKDGEGVRIRLCGVHVPIAEPVRDTRPKASRVISHSPRTADDLIISGKLKIPTEKYVLDLGIASVEEGLRHSYSIKGLPAEYNLCLGFAVSNNIVNRVSEQRQIRKQGGKAPSKSAKELRTDPLLFRELGVKKLHIHLASTDGTVLISKTFDFRETFTMASPFDSKLRGMTGIATQGSRITWRATENTASGSKFVVKNDTEYILQITVLEVEDLARKSVLYPIIRSE